MKVFKGFKYNQGFKEATFIQMDRRSGVRQTGGEAVWCRNAEATAVVAEEKRGIPLEQMITAPGRSAKGSSTSKIDPSLPLAVKISGG